MHEFIYHMLKSCKRGRASIMLSYYLFMQDPGSGFIVHCSSVPLQVALNTTHKWTILNKCHPWQSWENVTWQSWTNVTLDNLEKMSLDNLEHMSPLTILNTCHPWQSWTHVTLDNLEQMSPFTILSKCHHSQPLTFFFLVKVSNPETHHCGETTLKSL